MGEEKTNPLSINFLSMVTTPIEICFNDKVISTGTGFFYSYGDKVYLITNKHNVTGINETTGDLLDRKNLSKPNKLRLTLHTQLPDSNKGTFNSSQFIKHNVYINNEEFTSPKWWEYPGGGFDVVVIPSIIDESIKDKVVFNCINECPFFYKERTPFIGDEVFIIGYPWGLKGGTQVLPIWKRGSISTEPNINLDGKQKILIDSKTTKGMSGSPVIYSYSGIYNKNIGTFTNFLGVYSGRMNEKIESKKEENEELPNTTRELEDLILQKIREKDITTDLGIVWKEEIIETIIRHTLETRIYPKEIGEKLRKKYE